MELVQVLANRVESMLLGNRLNGFADNLWFDFGLNTSGTGGRTKYR
jgi:hypothetical protein